MKKQFLLKQVCGLCIGVAGALVPLSSVQSADELSDRYLNGYLNDPYTNEVAPDTPSVMPLGPQGPIRTEATNAEDRQMMVSEERFEPLGTELYNPPSQISGAQGPIRTDASTAEGSYTAQGQQRFEPLGTELYNPPSQISGAQGPIRTEGSYMAQGQQRFEPLGTELYNPPVQRSGAQGPIRSDSDAVAEETKW